MSKTEFIEHIQSLVSEANTEKALKDLVAYLDADIKYRRLEDIALKAQAQHSKTVQDEEKGILSFEKAKLNNNIITETILQLLRDVENDNLNPKTYQVEKDKEAEKQEDIKTRRWQLWASLGTFAVIALGVTYWIFSDYEGSCPSFIPSSDFNIMILPFDNLDGNSDRPHIKIREGIEKKIRDYKLKDRADVKTNLKKFEEGQGITEFDAEAAALECNAKLVMWGSSERVGEEKEITASYKLLANDGALNLTQLDIDETGTDIATVKTISSIKSGGSLTLNVETIIKAFFGLISHELDRKEEAVANLEDVVNAMNPQDSNHLVFTNILAADYIALKDTIKAMETYDKLLNAHPDYKLANANQGILLYKKGEYVEAIQKLDRAIKAAPDNESLIRTRGDAYLKDGQYNNARMDYVAATKIKNANNQVLDSRITALEQKVSDSKEITKVDIPIPASPGNHSWIGNSNTNRERIKKYEEQANGSRRLGDYARATHYAKALLKYDKKNYVAHRILIEEQQIVKKNSKSAKKLFDKAIDAGADKEKLYKAFPELRPKNMFIDRSKSLSPKLNLRNLNN